MLLFVVLLANNNCGKRDNIVNVNQWQPLTPSTPPSRQRCREQHIPQQFKDFTRSHCQCGLPFGWWLPTALYASLPASAHSEKTDEALLIAHLRWLVVALFATRWEMKAHRHNRVAESGSGKFLMPNIHSNTLWFNRNFGLFHTHQIWRYTFMRHHLAHCPGM